MSLFVLMMTGALLGAAVVFGIFYHYSQQLPDYDQLANYEPPNVTRLYSSDGRLMEEYAKEKRVFVPITAIPNRLKNAFIAAEDQNFYSHPGVDVTSIARAMVTNAKNYLRGGGGLVGGSTITQQVVKNFLLTSERSLERKVKEAILSFRISKVYSKDKVLELYLNQIYLGHGSYGVAAAALEYFNRSIDELAIEEAALLAAMPKAPSSFDPNKNYERALERRNWVIGRMLDEGYITEAEAKQAVETPINLREPELTEVAEASVYSEEVRRWLVKKYGNDTLYEGGLVVHTPLVPSYQSMAEEALLKGVVAYEKRHGYRGPLGHLDSLQDWREQLKGYPQPAPSMGAWELGIVTSVEKDHAYVGLNDGEVLKLPLADLTWARRILDTKTGRWGPPIKKAADVVAEGDVIVVERGTDTEGEETTVSLRQLPKVSGGAVMMDPHTGRVLAMVGGTRYKDAAFNRVTQAKRQPGSAFKPFIYLAGLEKGYTPSTIIVDSPIALPQGPGLPLWRPQNYANRFYGPTTMRNGLEKSLNVMTVKLSLDLGIDRIREVSQRLHIYGKELPRNFSIVLGAAETTLMDLAGAYAMVVNGGKEVTPVLVEKIQNRHGKLIYRADTRFCDGCNSTATPADVSTRVPYLPDVRESLIDPMTAYQLTSVLEGVVQRGTGTKAKALGKPVAGKTGTTNNSHDAWFVGFTPDLVTGVYIGYDQPKELGRRETGGSVALPVFVDIMQQALKDKPSTPFRVPSGMQLVKVDLKTGQRPGFYSDPKNIIFEAFKPGTGPQTRPILGYDRASATHMNDGYDQGGNYIAPGEGGYGSPSAPQGGYGQPPAGGYYAPPAAQPAYPSQGGGYAPAQPPQAPQRPTVGTGGLY